MLPLVLVLCPHQKTPRAHPGKSGVETPLLSKCVFKYQILYIKMFLPLIFMSFFCTLKSQAMLKHESVSTFKHKSLESLLFLLMRLNQCQSFSTETSNTCTKQSSAPSKSDIRAHGNKNTGHVKDNNLLSESSQKCKNHHVE